MNGKIIYTDDPNIQIVCNQDGVTGIIKNGELYDMIKIFRDEKLHNIYHTWEKQLKKD